MERDCRVSLFIYGNDLEPNHITQVLDLEPTDFRRRGYQRLLPSGSMATQKTGVWSYNTETDVKHIDDRLSILLDEVSKKHVKLADIDSVEEVNFDIFCTVEASILSESGFRIYLRASDVSRIAAVGGSITLTISLSEDQP